MKNSRLFKKLWALLAGGLMVLALLWVFRQPIFQGFVEAWTVDIPLEKADAIVVLGGGVDIRPFEAARLYKQGKADRVLVAAPPLRRTAQLGLVKSHGELNCEVLRHEGVPEEVIFILGKDLSNTFQEATAVRQWVETAAAKVIIIPTEFIHTRRVGWMFDKVLAGSGCKAIVTAVENPEYASHNWWMSEAGVVAVQNEVLKYVYYRLKY
jgi:uncharacterized SAM-binding protein YcdF (DUF218 family)